MAAAHLFFLAGASAMLAGCGGPCNSGPSGFELTTLTPMALTDHLGSAEGSVQLQLTVELPETGEVEVTSIPCLGDATSGVTVEDRSLVDAPESGDDYDAVVVFELVLSGEWETHGDLFPALDVVSSSDGADSEIELWSGWTLSTRWWKYYDHGY